MRENTPARNFKSVTVKGKQDLVLYIHTSFLRQLDLSNPTATEGESDWGQSFGNYG